MAHAFLGHRRMKRRRRAPAGSVCPHRLPLARRESHAARGRAASDAPAHGAGLAAVRQGRPPPDRRNALRRGDPRESAGVARDRSTTLCTSSPRSACCGRSRSTARRPISTPTSPRTTTSSSKARTSCSTSRTPRSSSARPRRRRRAWKSPASTWSSGCAARAERAIGSLPLHARPGRASV